MWAASRTACYSSLSLVCEHSKHVYLYTVRLKQTTTKTESFSFKISNISSRKFPTLFSGFVCINLFFSKLAALPSSVWVGINSDYNDYVRYSVSEWNCFDIKAISPHNAVWVKRKISKLGIFRRYKFLLGLPHLSTERAKNNPMKNFATFSTYDIIFYTVVTHSVIPKSEKFRYSLSTKMTKSRCFYS